MGDDCHGCTLHALPKRNQISSPPQVFVHRIFFIAILSGLVGGAYLGVHLWLMRNGAMPAWENYFTVRSLHAAIQLYLFFGLFPTGFILQPETAFLGVKSAKTVKVAIAAPALVCFGIMLALIFPQSLVGLRISSTGFIVAAAYFAAFYVGQLPPR